MRTMLQVLALLGLSSFVGDATADADALDRVFARWNSSASPGCSVGVERDGSIVALKAYGSADLEHGVPNTPTTVFEVGSVSKQFTAAAIVMLAEENRLAFTDDIRRYLPELPDYGTVITIDHLLTHTSGLRDWGFLDELTGWGRLSRFATNRDVLDVAVRQKALNHAPGAEYSYTNTGYDLLATVVERVSGMSLAEFTRLRMFGPLKMNSTQWRDDYQRVVPQRAVPYKRHGDGPWFKWLAHENVVGDSGLMTTATDLLKWNAAMRSGALGPFVSQEMVRTAALTDGTGLAYARGLQVGPHLGTDAVWHLGGMFGYRAALGRYSERNLSIAIVCNAGDIEFGEQALLDEVAALFLAPAPAKSTRTGHGRLAPGHAGLYVNDRTHMPLRIVPEAGGLKVAGGEALEPLSSSRFRLRGNEGAFVDHGHVRIRNAIRTWESYHRVAEYGVDVTLDGPLTGTYHNPETDARFLISKEDGELVLKIDRRPDFRAVLRPVYADAVVYDTRFGPGTAIVRFLRDADSQVSGLSVGWNVRVRDLRFHRIATRDD